MRPGWEEAGPRAKMEAEVLRQDNGGGSLAVGPRSAAFFEACMVSRVDEYLRQYLYDSATFLCERLVAELPSEVCNISREGDARMTGRKCALPLLLTITLPNYCTGQHLLAGSMLSRFQSTAPRVSLPQRRVGEVMGTAHLDTMNDYFNNRLPIIDCAGSKHVPSRFLFATICVTLNRLPEAEEALSLGSGTRKVQMLKRLAL